jgi:hypothetical protein
MKRLCDNTDERAKREIACGVMPVLVIAMCIGGCGKKGPELSPISGRVTFQGKAVSTGVVRLSNPSAGIDILATLQPDGTYSAHMGNDKGLPNGTYAVAVMPPRVDVPVGAMTAPPTPKRPDIPERYRNPSTSGLKTIVKSGENSLDIDMHP